MGGMGPRSPQLQPTGGMMQPPYRMKDNQDTWLDQTDLVFIDPVGTGFSRAKSIEVARRMNGVQGDIQSVGEFMRMYINRNNRQLSPLFIAGESYGTFRAAGLAGYLIDRGIAFNGVVLIGTTLNLETIWSRSDDLVYQLEFPTYAADAYYHKKVAPDLQRKDLKSFLKEVEAFAIGDYALALSKGDDLSPAERKATIDKLVRYTGLDAHYLDETNLRWDVSHFARQLLRDKHETIGRYDGRLIGPSGQNTARPASMIRRAP
jgi:carboxypeptidase C (cathepsin A)